MVYFQWTIVSSHWEYLFRMNFSPEEARAIVNQLMCHEVRGKLPNLEYMFLYAGKFMPGMEKLAGELFFPTNQQFLTTEGSKNSWF